MRGVVLSYFPNGYGFLRALESTPELKGRRQYFYHILQSPNIDTIYLGMKVDFEVKISERTGKEEAVNLMPAEGDHDA